MAKVDKALTANLLMINGSDEFKAFREYLKDQQQTWIDQCVSQKDEVSLRFAQGRAQMMKDILELLAQAPALADKYRG